MWVRKHSDAKEWVPKLKGATTGSILYDINSGSLKKELFTIIGRSYNEIALVRLYEQSELMTSLSEKWYRLGNKIKSAGSTQFLFSVYADLSNLIVKDQLPLVQLLNKYPDRLAGVVHKSDLAGIVNVLHTVDTISKELKDKYFSI